MESWHLGGDKKLTLISPDGESVLLTPGQAKIINALIESPGKAISKGVLGKLWIRSGVYTSDNRIDRQLSRVRERLATFKKRRPAIVTHYSWGHAFIDNLER